MPTTTGKLQEALRGIGISAHNPQDFFLYDYRSPQSDFHSIGQIIDYPDNVDYYVHLPDVTGTGQLGDYYLNRSGMVDMPEEYRVMAYPAPEADRDAFRTEQPAPAAVLPEAAPIITKDKSKDEYMKEITDRLEAGVRGIMSSDNYKSYLASMSKFNSYSFRNTMLIFMQKPDASLVAGLGKWKS